MGWLFWTGIVVVVIIVILVIDLIGKSMMGHAGESKIAKVGSIIKACCSRRK